MEFLIGLAVGFILGGFTLLHFLHPPRHAGYQPGNSVRPEQTNEKPKGPSPRPHGRRKGGAKPEKPDSLPNVESTPTPPTSGRWTDGVAWYPKPPTGGTGETR